MKQFEELSGVACATATGAKQQANKRGWGFGELPQVRQPGGLFNHLTNTFRDMNNEASAVRLAHYLHSFRKRGTKAQWYRDLNRVRSLMEESR